jgi:nicotinate-nucleotide adenylyltransferase
VIFGGSFDPIHVAHLVLAESALDALPADEVLFVPAGRPPHKREGSLSDSLDREEMVRLAIAENDRFRLSRVELDREGPSFAIDTIRAVAELSGARPYYLIGADSLVDLPGWKLPGAILEEAEVVAGGRPGVEVGAGVPFSGRVRMIDAPAIDVSSTEIRLRVRRGATIRYLVPEAVRAYISRRGLYRSAGGC